MTLPSDLQEAYASARGGRIREGLTLTHPRFTRPYHLTPAQVGFAADDGDGGTVFYEPAPVSIAQMGHDGGASNMPIQIAAIPTVVSELVRGSTRGDKPITMTLREYLGSDLVPKQVRTFSLTELVVDEGAGVVGARAGIPALVAGSRWPRGPFFRVSLYPGLDRQ